MFGLQNKNNHKKLGAKQHPVIMFSALEKSFQSKQTKLVAVVPKVKLSQRIKLTWSFIQTKSQHHFSSVGKNISKLHLKLLTAFLPFLTVLGYLVYRLYGVLRTFAH